MTRDDRGPGPDARGPTVSIPAQNVSGGVGVLVQEAAPRYPRFAGNLRDRGNEPLIGRDPDLARLAECLADVERHRVLVLCGPSGVGKTALAERFARQHAERYPGGVFFARVDSAAPPEDLARIGMAQLGLVPGPGESMEIQCERALAALGHEPTLLIYDDVPDPRVLDTWAPPSTRRFHVLVTSTYESWDRREVLPIEPLDAHQSAALFDDIVARVAEGRDVPARDRLAIIEQAEGLPVQLSAVAYAVARAARRGRGRDHTGLHQDTASSFGRAWSLLDEPARLAMRAAALFEPRHIPEEPLLELLVEGAGMTRHQAEDAVDACRDRHLLDSELRMHALLAEFVRDHAGQDAPALPEPLIAAHARRFAVAAVAVRKTPADPDAVRALDAYPAALHHWRAMGASQALAHAYLDITVAWYQRGRFAEALAWAHANRQAAERALAQGTGDHERVGTSLHWIGTCHAQQGKWSEARVWFERAVAETKQGDVDGRVDHASLGKSLHMVGRCWSEQGEWSQARAWYERAVAEAKQGDVHGRVDHASLGKGLHMVGWCWSKQGEWSEARVWYERAVAEAEQEDVHGRVDHASLGGSLHQVGVCWSKQGAWSEARVWFERAVAEAEQGDVHGRVDHEFLGRSLHEVGRCWSEQGAWSEARVWYERAVAEKEQGDVHDRVNHDSLGRSLSTLAWAHSELGEPERTAELAERALVAARRGDIFGRVNDREVAKIEGFLARLRA